MLYAIQYPDSEEYETRLNRALERTGDYRLGENRLSATWHGSVLDNSRESRSESRSEGRLYWA